MVQVLTALAVVVLSGVAALALAYDTSVRGVRALRRAIRTLRGAAPARIAAPVTADLSEYPARLERLQTSLRERIGVVDAQRKVLEQRRDEFGAKGRDALARKYESDANLLHRRSASMRRVLALVWKTRAILLLRVHLAITARRRPVLDALPQPSSAGVDLDAAARQYEDAASSVRAYLEIVSARARGLEDTLPPPPEEMDAEVEVQGSIDRERAAVTAAYAELAERMDHLADNLTFLGDHFQTLRVADSGPAEVGAVGPGPLLEEVSRALAELKELAGRVDPSVVDDALTHLADDIGQLEEAGLEAEAEAEAHLEVERLLGRLQHS
jgi:hypothetical protein